MNEVFIQQTTALRPYLDRLQRRSLLVGLAGSAVLVAGAFSDPEQFYRSYLLGFLFCLGLPLGSLAILMLHHLVGGGWGFAIRRLLESGTRTLPLLLLFFAPILFGLHHLYGWTRPEVVAADQILQHKAGYLNTPFFVLRAALYFAVWLTLTFLLNHWSAAQDRTTETYPTHRLQVLSGPGIILYVLSMTFAAIDWVMSLEPHWFSTIYGVIHIVGQGLLTWALIIAVAVPLSRQQPLSAVLTTQRLRDLGTLTLAFVLLWTYVSFAQFLIIWSANLPEEITWYMRRLHGGWEVVGILLMVFHFALPFFLLISSRLKSRLGLLTAVAVGLLVMRLVDLWWITTPAFSQEGMHLHWLDLAAPVGMGGLCLSVFFWQLKARSLIPLNDPRFADVISGEDEHRHG